VDGQLEFREKKLDAAKFNNNIFYLKRIAYPYFYGIPFLLITAICLFLIHPSSLSLLIILCAVLVAVIIYNLKKDYEGDLKNNLTDFNTRCADLIRNADF
jgi:ABC-type transport system involved in cytochrome bd biosynthesis fused ATPase/permease subunit